MRHLYNILNYDNFFLVDSIQYFYRSVNITETHNRNSRQCTVNNDFAQALTSGVNPISPNIAIKMAAKLSEPLS